MKKVTLALASAAAISSAPAFAQDDSWTGPYLGLGLGVTQSNSNATASVVGSGSGSVIYIDPANDTQGLQGVGSLDSGATAKLGQNNVFGTIEAGYDFQVGKNFVVGAFANFDYMFGNRGKNSTRTNLSSTGSWLVGHDEGDLVDPTATTAAINRASPCPAGGATCTYDNYEWDHGLVDQQAHVRTQDAWALGVRAGGLVSNKTLLYVSGGYTQAKINMGLSATIQPSIHDYAGIAGSSSTARTFAAGDHEWEREGGYFLGAGIETKLSRNISAKLDYRYSDFGSRAISGTGQFGFFDGLTDVDGKYEILNVSTNGALSAKNIKTHAVRAVVAYRF